MNAHQALPIPGLLFGMYPERDVQPANAWQSRCNRATKWISGLLTANTDCVTQVRVLEKDYAHRSDGEIDDTVIEVRRRLRRHGLNDEAMLMALALTANVIRRTLGQDVYDVQILTARILLRGELAEMATGEGKSLAVAMAAAVAAMAGVPVHLVTSNDYLAQRDAGILASFYSLLGLTVGVIQSGMDAGTRRHEYAMDVCYCTAKELVFDYLRDRSLCLQTGSLLEARCVNLMPAALAKPVLRGLCWAMVDEADSILIDEARVPFVLSKPARKSASSTYLTEVLRLAGELRISVDYVIDQSAAQARLTEAGVHHLLAVTRNKGPEWCGQRRVRATVELALSALQCYRRGQEYLVRAGHVIPIDATTGRALPGRHWGRGLQQLIETKEGCTANETAETAARITYQRFFPRYLRLSGLSGTLSEARAELSRVYGLRVRTIPLRVPTRRMTLGRRLCSDKATQWRIVCERTQALQAAGRAVLIGTESVTDSEALSGHLQRLGVPHQVLNARQDAAEAAVVAVAGRAGCVTVATNIAGRGTDISIDAEVAGKGGLHLILCQQSPARRIEQQFIGRCARQGTPGSVEWVLSFDGALTQRYLPAWLRHGRRGRDEVCPGWLVGPLLRVLQCCEEHRQQRDRRELSRHDDTMMQRLNCWGLGE